MSQNARKPDTAPDRERLKPSTPVHLTSAQKAAVIITALPPDDASKLLDQLGPAHIKTFVRATTELKNVPAAALERVILEFLDSLNHRDLALGPDVAREILSRIMSTDAVSGIIDGVSGKKRSVWEDIAECDDAAIADFMEKEHPRTASIVLGQLPPEKAAAVLNRLSPESAERCIGRLKTNAEVPPPILQAIADTLQRELLGKRSDSGKPDAVVGAIFDSLSDQTREPLLKSLTDNDPSFARAVQRQMFLFDDIGDRIEPRDIPTITRAVDQGMLKTALGYARGRGSPGADFILSNMSRRLAEQLEEELGEMGPVTAKNGEGAEAGIVRTIKLLAERGEIKLIVQEDEDAA